MYSRLPAQKVMTSCAHLARRLTAALMALLALSVTMTAAASATPTARAASARRPVHAAAVPLHPHLLAPGVRVPRLAPAGTIVPRATLGRRPAGPPLPKRALAAERAAIAKRAAAVKRPASVKRATAVRGDSAFSAGALAWGADGAGELGDGGSTVSVPTPQGITLPAGTALTQTSAGDDHSLAVAADGSVWAWGSDAQGQLGDGGSSQDSAPVHLNFPGGAAEVSAGSMYSLALTRTGQVYAWGRNDTGQLGNGSVSNTPVSTPALVSLPSGTTVTHIAAGLGTGYALTSSGQVYAWGDDTIGELGNGTTSSTPVSTPTLVSLPSGDTATQISSKGYFAEALLQGGTVLSWGAGLSGTLGNGGTSASNTPVQVSLPTGTTVTQISAGHSFSLALTSGGTALAWGAGSKGQIGNGSTSEEDSPVAVGLPGGVAVTEVAAGGAFGLALGSDGQAYAWGDDSLGALGAGSSGGQSATPAPITLPAGTALGSVSAGLYHALGVLAPVIASVSPDIAPAYGGTPVTITGTGLEGVTGVKFGGKPAPSFSAASETSLTTKAPAGTAGATAISLTAATGVPPALPGGSFGYVGASTVASWGAGFAGDLGNGIAANTNLPGLTALPAGVTVTQLSAANDTSFALTSTGAVYQWGALPNSLVPVPVAFPSGTKITEISAQAYGGLALSADGTVYAWGFNADGELGDGDTNYSVTPVKVQIPSGVSITQIAGEGLAGLALSSTGQIYSWGSGTYGQLGDNATGNRLTPGLVSLPSGITATQIAGEDLSGLALASNGQLLAWGYNSDGELGNGSTTPSSVPVAVSLPSGTSVSQIAGESFDGLALTSAGRVLAWGANGNGELGNGSSTPSSFPVSVSLPAGTSVTQLGAEWEDGLAVTSTGALLTWGAGGSGQAGNGTNADAQTPVKVTVPAGIAATAVTRGFGFGGQAVVGTPPIVSGLTSPLGPVSGGATVTVSGANLSGVSAVRFGTKAATSVKLVSSSTITAVAPAGSGTVDVRLTGPGGSSAVVPADHFTYVASGAAIGWGEGDSGQLGNGAANRINATAVVAALPAGTTVTQVADGYASSYALTSNGQVYAWGANNYGQLGNGSSSTQIAATPALVHLPAGVKVSQIAAACNATFALTSTGQVYAWGYDADGEIGNGSVGDMIPTPALSSLPSGVRVTQLAAGCQGAYALSSSGQVYDWGYGGDGELGNGSLVGSSVPIAVPLPAGTAVAAIAAEGYNGLVLTADGRLLAWGYNGNGEVGNGQTQGNVETPVQVQTPGTITGIGANSFDGLALTAGGTLYSWGWGVQGQRGSGDASDSGTPTAVSLPTGTVVTSFAGGFENSYALTATGRVYAWGDNVFGELGDGVAGGQSTVPVQVAIPSGLTVTSLGGTNGSHELATVSIPASTAASLFAANATSDSITAYAPGVTGNASPVTAISGPATELAGPAGIAVDGSGSLLVADSAGNAVTGYPAGAGGNVFPATALVGPDTGLSSPQSVALDGSGRLYVANAAANSITEYASGASGDAAPAARIAGSATGLSSPHQIAIDASGNLWVADRGANAVLEFAAGASGNVAPIARISGTSTGLSAPTGLAFGGGTVRVADQNANSVAAFPGSAKGNIAPSSTLAGAATALKSPAGVALSPSGEVAVADSSSGALTLYGSAATGNSAPASTISGAATELSGTDGVAFAPAPVAVTGATEAVTSTQATLDGQVTASGSDTQVYFQYEAHGAASWTYSKTVDAGSHANAATVKIPLTGVTPATTYTYRLVARSAAGTTVGATRTFTTAAS